MVLQEMKRVTKKGGILLIVDYMEPRKHPLAQFMHPLISLYETPNYKPFITRGLTALLKTVKLNMERETHFFGLFQIVVVQNT